MDNSGKKEECFSKDTMIKSLFDPKVQVFFLKFLFRKTSNGNAKYLALSKCSPEEFSEFIILGLASPLILDIESNGTLAICREQLLLIVSLLGRGDRCDIEINCEDGIVLHASRVILAARSEVLDRMLYNGMKESTQNEIYLPKINSKAMQVVLEFLYTGSIGEKTLTGKNAIEVFHASDYFMLPDLQDYVMIYIENCHDESKHDSITRLYTKFVEIMGPLTHNELFKRLFHLVASTPLDYVSYNTFSGQSLQVLLSHSLEMKDEYFATSEYGVFRYLVLWGANQVSRNAVTLFQFLLPSAESILAGGSFNIRKEKKHSRRRHRDHQNYYQGNGSDVDDNDNEDDDLAIKESNKHQIKESLRTAIIDIISSTLPFIDFRLFDPDVLVNVIEPLDIIPSNILYQAYRYHSTRKMPKNTTRGLAPPLRWDRNKQYEPFIRHTGDNDTLIISKNQSHLVFKTTQGFKNGYHKWDIIVEESFEQTVYIGVCSTDIDHLQFLGNQKHGWVFGSDGTIYHDGESYYYGEPFDDLSKITVHLDMNKRTLAFSIDGDYFGIAFTNIPSKVYPAISLTDRAQFKIREHK
ncbi:13131_t:CDS:2 [Entrophospora sp. SA101]|nr:13131_t:CDS:2 [Entrophospora sp. SA101]